MFLNRENIPSRSLERSDIDSNEILELEGKAPIPPKLPPLRGPPGVMPRELAEEPNDVLRANEELNFIVGHSKFFLYLNKLALLPIPGGETVPARPPVSPVRGFKLP